MIRSGIANLVRFILGILLLQTATAVQVYAALQTDKPVLWAVFGGLTLVLGVMAALWFSAVLRHAQKDAVDNMRERFSKERENIRLRAEREKAKVIKQSHQQMIKDRDRTQGRANMKVGASFAGVIGLGGLMLFTQFVTFGMLLMGTAGGALAGYALRIRHEFKTRGQESNNLPRSPELKRIGRQSVRKLGEAIVGKPEDKK